jgi:hypothetical protein
LEELDEYRERLLNRYNSVMEDLAQVATRASTAGVEHTSQEVLSIITQLRDEEVQIFLPRLSQLLNQTNPVEIEIHPVQKEGLQSLLADLIAIHKVETKWLNSMDEDGWNQITRLPSWGERTLQWWVEYSLFHLEQHLTKLRRMIPGSD